MKNTKIIFGPEIDAALHQLIDYVEADELPAVLRFLDRLQNQLTQTLLISPEGGPRFQGEVRMLVVERYIFLYQYYPDRNEVHVLDLKMPGQNWR